MTDRTHSRSPQPQFATLVTAPNTGYFDVTERVTRRETAEDPGTLGLSVSERLRRAERRLAEGQFSPGE